MLLSPSNVAGLQIAYHTELAVASLYMAINEIHDPKMHPTLFHDLIMIFITYLPRDTVHEV